MIKLNVHEPKTHLSGYLAKLEQRETIVLCKGNRPIAEIRPLRALPDAPRPVGLAKDIFRGLGKLLRTVAAVDHRGLRRRPLVMLICQAIAQGLVILAPDPDITRYPLRTAW